MAILSSWEPAAPRLTWYGEAGERVELSGRVLGNWVIKTGNLLSNECAAGPGTEVLLDLPAHWRLLTWTLGTWAIEAEVTDDPDSAEVVVSHRPEHWDGHGGEVVAVPLASLAMSWPTPLPAGIIDGAAELMGQPDQPLFASLPAVRPRPPGPRRLLLADEPAALVDAAWACWGEGGSVVVATPRPEAELDSIRAQEAVTAP